jgi:hypothetical protein
MAFAQEVMPKVILVHPSATVVPANLLRISIQFFAQVEGPVLPRLSLLAEDGRPIEEPFLEQELWSPDGKILTVLMHPGRVKTGLKARAEKGPILASGTTVTLAIDGHSIKQWHVGPVDDAGPQPSAWKLSVVAAQSVKPLVVVLDAPIDAQDADYIAVADMHGRRVPGSARLTHGERTWTFVPDAPWRSETYRLVARGTLEDPSGNRVGSRFETSIDAPPGDPADVSIRFRTIGPGCRQTSIGQNSPDA